MSDRPRRRPQAFLLDEVRLAPSSDPSGEADPAPDDDAVNGGEAAITTVTRVHRRRFGWAGLLSAALGGLIILAVALSLDRLITDLFDRAGWLGWVGLALTAVAGLSLTVLALREIAGVASVRRIDAIRRVSTQATRDDSRPAALLATRDLIALYRQRPETARGRAALASHAVEIIDGRDLIGLAETELLSAFDDRARRAVLASAKRVSIVTAITPRPSLGVLFVLYEVVRLIRRLGGLYGERPGLIGFVGMTRSVFAHLAVTGGMAAGDSLFQQILGHGLAARVSARLGEGVINGLLTARIGIAAIEVCRPLPFIRGRPPRIGDVMAELVKASPEEPASRRHRAASQPDEPE